MREELPATNISVQAQQRRECAAKAAREGFEPSEAFTSAAFKAAALVHYAISPAGSYFTKRRCDVEYSMPL